MENRSVGEYLLEQLKQNYVVRPVDIGKDSRLDKGLMHYTVRTYDIEELGHFCLLNMKGMFGLMKMETAVLSVFEKDVPLVNYDIIQVAGKKTQMVEFYDTFLSRDDSQLQKECMSIKKKDAGLEDYISGEHWYDSLLLKYSYAKKTAKGNRQADESCIKYMDAIIRELGRANPCDRNEKKAAVRRFAQGLLDNGGPAVNTMRKQFGDEMTEKLVLSYMYGLK